MSRVKDLSGQRFGRLTVIEFAGTKGRRDLWKCRCDCGNTCVVMCSSLKSGNTKSCGCLQRENATKAHLVHGLSYSSVYRIWKSMCSRCFDTRRKAYKNYGGRGITVCDEWRDDIQTFYNYVSTLEHFGEEGYTLDRIDNDGNYEPNNVRWATRKEQGLNRRTTITVEYNGEEICLKEAAKRSKIKYSTLRARYKRGIRGENLFKPAKYLSRLR